LNRDLNHYLNHYLNCSLNPSPSPNRNLNLNLNLSLSARGAFSLSRGAVCLCVRRFCASQNLLAGAYLPPQADRDALKAADPDGYAARKEQTDSLFDDAIAAVGASAPKEILLYLSPLTGEWEAPRHQYLLPGRGEPPTGWMRKGPGAITRAWCCFEMVKTLAEGCTLHVVLSPADVDGFQALLTTRFDDIAGMVAGLDARDAQISKLDDRDYILGEVAKLDGGLDSVTTTVCTSLREWLAAEGKAALVGLPMEQRGTSTLLMSVARLLKAQGKLDEAAPLYREALEARRATLGDRHPSTLVSIGNMASLLQAQGKLDEAAPLSREALEASRATLGDRHPSTLVSMNNMASLLRAQGKLDEAAPLSREAKLLCREAVEGARAVLGNDHPHTKFFMRMEAQMS
jgi:tetratricopeptide (TPR) repeat protein